MLRMTKSSGGYIDSSATLGMTRKSARNDNESTNVICAHLKKILRQVSE